MSVLKGSAATALYGPEGRNGAVIITTRKGKNGQASITYDGSVEISNADYIHELQNQYGGGYSQTFDTFSYDPAKDLLHGQRLMGGIKFLIMLLMNLGGGQN